VINRPGSLASGGLSDTLPDALPGSRKPALSSGVKEGNIGW